MSIRKESTGNVEVCDGCGRSDSGPGTSMDVEAVMVHDPNVGGTVQQHLCPHCRANRGLTETPLVIGDWVPAQPQPSSDESGPRSRSPRSKADE